MGNGSCTANNQPPTSVLSKKESDYRSNCTTGFKGKKRQSEVHHLVCDIAVTRRLEYYPDDDEQASLIESCLQVSGWDINEAKNLIGLPRNYYFRSHANKPLPPWPAAEASLPSHQVDHNTTGGYTDEVGTYLQTKVFGKVKKGKKEKSHEITPESLKQSLEDAADHFRTQLVAVRAIRQGGVHVCWPARHANPKWYEPFSMAIKPNPRDPGPKGKVPASKLYDIFQQLK